MEFDVNVLVNLAVLLMGYGLGYRVGKEREDPWPMVFIWTVLFVLSAILLGSNVI